MNNNQSLQNIIQSVKDPKQAVLSMVGPNIPPVVQNLLKMAENGDYAGVESFARNIFKEQGRDFDKEFQNMQQLFRK